MSNLQLQVWATVIGSHLKKEPTASPVLTKWWKLELTLATNFGSHAQMVTKFGGQILATKFGFVPDCSTSGAREHFRIWYDWKLILTSFVWVTPEKTLSSRSLYFIMSYRKISDISHTLVGYKIVDHSDVVGASPVGAAPTTSSFSTWLQYIEQRQLQAETRNIWCGLY